MPARAVTLVALFLHSFLDARWAVDADEYSDTLVIGRKDLYRCFAQHWPSGRDDMAVWSYYHYKVGQFACSDGDRTIPVGMEKQPHRDFNSVAKTSSTNDLPHGFKDFFQEECNRSGPIGIPPRVPDPGTAEHRQHVVAGEGAAISGARLAYWSSSDEQQTERSGSAVMSPELREAHEATEASFMELEKALHLKLDRMETTVDALTTKLSDAQRCVKSVLDHFSVEPADRSGMKATERERNDTIAALKRELRTKSKRITELEEQVATLR